MVESGLADRIEVSQYRLTAHLVLALVIYAATLWTALGLLEYPSPPFRGEREADAKRRQPPDGHPPRRAFRGEVGCGERSGIPHLTPALSAPRGREGVWLRRGSEAVLGLVGLTIVAGGFVAGLNAGLTYNTFPLMDGSFVPAGYAQLSPFVRNWFENVAAVQFDHRILAMTTVGSAIVLWLAGRSGSLPAPVRRALHMLLAIALLQLLLGISTLLLVVPIPLAAAHQAGAVLLLTAGLVLRHRLRAA
jgi:cytochrome c oxidase assembly protein subunit 15